MGAPPAVAAAASAATCWAIGTPEGLSGDGCWPGTEPLRDARISRAGDWRRWPASWRGQRPSCQRVCSTVARELGTPAIAHAHASRPAWCSERVQTGHQAPAAPRLDAGFAVPCCCSWTWTASNGSKKRRPGAWCGRQATAAAELAHRLNGKPCGGSDAVGPRNGLSCFLHRRAASKRRQSSSSCWKASTRVGKLPWRLTGRLLRDTALDHAPSAANIGISSGEGIGVVSAVQASDDAGAVLRDCGNEYAETKRAGHDSWTDEVFDASMHEAREVSAFGLEGGTAVAPRSTRPAVCECGQRPSARPARGTTSRQRKAALVRWRATRHGSRSMGSWLLHRMTVAEGAGLIRCASAACGAAQMPAQFARHGRHTGAAGPQAWYCREPVARAAPAAGSRARVAADAPKPTGVKPDRFLARITRALRLPGPAHQSSAALRPEGCRRRLALDGRRLRVCRCTVPATERRWTR